MRSPKYFMGGYWTYFQKTGEPDSMTSPTLVLFDFDFAVTCLGVVSFSVLIHTRDEIFSQVAGTCFLLCPQTSPGRKMKKTKGEVKISTYFVFRQANPASCRHLQAVASLDMEEVES